MMGMAMPETVETPRPKYQGTVVCSNCHAEYKPTQWVHGYSDSGTADHFTGVMVTSCDTCPVCKTKAN